MNEDKVMNNEAEPVEEKNEEKTEKTDTLKEIAIIIGVAIVCAIVIYFAVGYAKQGKLREKARADMHIVLSLITINKNDTKTDDEAGIYPTFETYADFADAYKEKYGEVAESPAEGWEYTVKTTENEYTIYAKGPKENQYIVCQNGDCKDKDRIE